jgi:predicted AAA+ superfamily ATPase
MNSETIKKAIVKQKEEFLAKDKFFHRAIEKDVFGKFSKTKEVMVITGLRRTGKSTLLRLILENLLQKKKIEKKQFLYLNFEDVRMADFTYHDFEKVIDLYQEIEEPDENKRIYLFFDEIQNVEFWEKWIYQLYETDKYRIFITGSNATLLSSELATALTGRNIPITMFPLSFSEYLTFFKKKEISKKSFYKNEDVRNIKKIWREFFIRGGMPEIVKTNSGELIREYFSNILLKDIVNRYNIKHKKELYDLARMLLANIGQITSLQKMGQAVELKNISTVKNYLQHLTDSFLFFSVPMFSFSYKQQVYNPDKFYLTDHGFFQKLAFRFSENKGNILENIVAIELKRREKEIFYYKTKNNLEVDFVVRGKNKIENLIQVSWSLDDEKTKEREIKALVKGMEEFNLKSGLILTEDEEDQFQKDGKKIKILPVWKWLLGK